MSTLRNVRRTLTLQLLSAALLALFAVVYRLLGYGVVSACHVWMFLIPLLGGALPLFAAVRIRGAGALSPLAVTLWNGGLTAFCFGCIFKGIVEVAGRFTDYDLFYWILGGLLLCAAAIAQLCRKAKRPQSAG